MARPLFSMVLALHESPALSKKRSEEVLAHFLTGVRDLLQHDDRFSLSLYLSGNFLKWAGQKKGALLSQLKGFIDAGRLEMLGGGYCDPLFPLLPLKMQQLQIQTHRELLERLTGRPPRGFWLPSYVWEQSMIELLVSEGFEYTVLRDYQIEKATWRNPIGSGYWTVEDRGDVLRILSAGSELPHRIEAGEGGEIAAEWSSSNREGCAEVIPFSFLRDRRGYYEGERFELLRKLIDQLAAVGDRGPQWRVLGDQIDERPAAAGMHLSSSVGKSLALDERLQSCRDLLLRQPESNFLHKRFIWLWRNIERLPEGRKKKNLELSLLPAGNVYWYRNGELSGGVRYLEDRAACHRILADVESDLRKAAEIEGDRFDAIDFLSNGDRQLLYSGDRFSFLFEGRLGGRLRFLEHRPRRLTVINGFHPPLPDHSQSVHFSVDPVSSLRDWYIPSAVEAVPDWLEYLRDDTGLMQGSHTCNFRIRRDGSVVTSSGEQLCQSEGRSHPVRIEKAIAIKERGKELLFSIQLTNLAFHALQGKYGVELNLSFADWDLEQQRAEVSGGRVISLIDVRRTDGVERLEYADRKSGSKWVVQAVKPAGLLTIPISVTGETGISLRQCLKAILFWDLKLMGQEKLSTTFSLRVDRLGGVG